MNNRQLGNSALQVSEICLGTMTFGEQNSEREAHAQLDRAFAAGVNFIDTAEMYPVPPRAATYGRTEEIVGNWLAGQSRQQVIVASKAAGPSRGLNWIRGGELAFDLASLRAGVEASLRRLRTDYVDLYQLHWPARNQPMFGQWQYDPAKEHESTPILETLQALATLVREGKIRYFGLSNEHPWGVMEFVRLAREHDLPRPVSLQNAYSLLNRVYESGLAEVCQRENIGLLPYSPLAFGTLSGKYLVDANAAGRITRFAGFGQRYTKFNVVPAVAAYADLARRHGLTPSQLALAFVYSRWFSASTIIGATSIAQLDENLGALAVHLSAPLLAEINELHLRYTNPAP
ncbi:MAG: aryl-alcohol dehydrogenase-like predicted oxidoreductase [Candidatus Accumulibacter regalis]|uniref:NADP(H)-dependent aldo-keto reductase n=2 Tax=Accumulibacter sp. TaxID=2053492 RepID=UPI001ACD1C40|nr:NADP(H)-dependent aldo-keto reductase [Accumulibacter sp.]MBN8512829.1 NADP(H)-dependent aldo-keto reductase [Accumulibacter sp.]HRE86476.1 NADP(H)-dependent aldo-keto reductase [Accumulibacter sp.]